MRSQERINLLGGELRYTSIPYTRYEINFAFTQNRKHFKYVEDVFKCTWRGCVRAVEGYMVVHF